MQRQDWTLLALSCAHGAGLSPAQLQKVLFVLGTEIPDAVRPAFYCFTPYHYGPFDAAIYRDAETMMMQGLVAISSDGRTRYYSATPAGRRRAALLHQTAPRNAVEYLDAVVKWAQSLSFSQMIKAVYAKYPEMSVNSVFRG